MCFRISILLLLKLEFSDCNFAFLAHRATKYAMETFRQSAKYLFIYVHTYFDNILIKNLVYRIVSIELIRIGKINFEKQKQLNALKMSVQFRFFLAQFLWWQKINI